MNVEEHVKNNTLHIRPTCVQQSSIVRSYDGVNNICRQVPARASASVYTHVYASLMKNNRKWKGSDNNIIIINIVVVDPASARQIRALRQPLVLGWLDGPVWPGCGPRFERNNFAANVRTDFERRPSCSHACTLD